jgi:hypothetical protein
MYLFFHTEAQRIASSMVAKTVILLINASGGLELALVLYREQPVHTSQKTWTQLVVLYWF